MSSTFTLSIYRRPRLPGDHMKKPAFLVHFYFMPERPTKAFWNIIKGKVKGATK